MKHLLSIAVFVLATAAAIAQGISPPADEDFRRTVRNIEAGNPGAFDEAGQSKNGRFLPYLLKQLTRREQVVRAGNYTTLQIALARLGNPEQLQEIACEFKYGSPAVRYSATKKMAAIAGWFGISSLARLLGPEPENTQRSSDRFGSYASPQAYSLQLLPTAIGNPPLSPINPLLVDQEPISDEQKHAVATWMNWLKANQSSLQVMLPNGDGVSIDRDRCKEVLKKDPEVVTYKH